MTEIKQQSDSKLNKQMSPVAIAAVAGVGAFACITYQYASLLRGLIVGAIVFPLMFYVVWKGQQLEKQKRDTAVASDQVET